MKRVLLACVIVVFLAPAWAIVEAVDYDRAVTGAGDPAVDVAAVQQAVDKGGTVLLKGTFDFGDKGGVALTRDVEIYGEIGSQDAPGATIKGGFAVFHTSLPADLPPAEPGPKVTIRNVHFQGALWTPIFLPYCSGAEITNNKITQLKPMASPVPIFGREDVFVQQGIVLVPHLGVPPEKRGYLPGAVTGNLIIADNDIDMTNDIPEKTMAQGVFIIGTTGANIEMLRNKVVNCARNSLESLDNYPGADGGGMTLIKGNTIVTAEKGISVPTPSTPNGVVVGWFLDLTGAADPARRTRIIVVNNDIETRGQTSMGIASLADGATIASNLVRMNGGGKARGIVQACSNAVIMNNKVEGTGVCAAFVTPFKELKANGNLLMNNDFSSFKPMEANVVLQSTCNVLMGGCGSATIWERGNLIID